MAEAAGNWSEAVAPLCRSLRVAAEFGDSYVFNRQGAAAHRKFLLEMAASLDRAVIIVEQLRRENSELKGRLCG